ncbi:hypothetical protein Dfri01_41360 [Dyadobacter frigoris]|nr:hypothetical protein Dfri01_41360 [Dyadobacter frigoris]
MLILYHNRYIFSIYDDTENYLDDYERYLEKPLNLWYLTAFKRERIEMVRKRMYFLLKNNRQIFDQLLARKDYSSWEAKKQTILEIYRWLEALPSGIQPPSDIDCNQWKLELETAIAPFLSASTQPMAVKSSKKSAYEHFCQVLSGADQREKRQKFERLISVLTREQWIAPTDNDGVYRFRNTGRGARLQLAALYYVLNKQGHIAQELMATQIAALFDSWLSHHISRDSFVKAFQPEQQDAFNCSVRQPRHKYVQDCTLLIRDL